MMPGKKLNIYIYIYIYIQKTHAWFKNPKLYTVNLEWGNNILLSWMQECAQLRPEKI